MWSNRPAGQLEKCAEAGALLTASSSAELPEPFAARREGDPEIPHAPAPAYE
jgi:hypothetical protein